MSAAAGAGAVVGGAPEVLHEDAAQACLLLAVDPVGLGGAVLRSLPGPALEEWLQRFRSLLPAAAAWRRLPLNIDDDRMLGGLDIAASLAAGRPVVASGLLAQADGGVVFVPMAERLQRGVAARISAVLDRQAVVLERDGIARIQPSRFCTLLVDEGLDEDEQVSPDLSERLAFHLGAEALEAGLDARTPPDLERLEQARTCYRQSAASAEQLQALCGLAMMLGIGSLRVPSLALRAARASAALAGRTELVDEDIQLATRLVLLPRATQLPMDPADEQQAEPPPEQSEQQQDDSAPPPGGEELPQELLLEAVRASLPPDLLDKLRIQALRRRGASGGRGGPQALAKLRGRPIGVRPGKPVMGERLHLPSTLKAAAPWQRLRAAHAPERGVNAPRLVVHTDDFRIQRFKARRQTTHIFVVDASGSSAVHRLAEAKGAIELLLAQSYVRRDQVALIAFRGAGAEPLLAPTRALARARRELAALPGGGGTPLAAGLDAAWTLARDLQRKGQNPVVVVMTDGRANVARDGSHGHEAAHADALKACRRLAEGGWSSLLVDTSRRPRPRARELASAMGAQYLPLPQANAGNISSAVQAASAA